MSKAYKDLLFQSYDKFATRLRLWFIAFGVGAPALLLSQEHIWDALEYATIKIILVLFFAGIGLQVLYTMLHKFSQYRLYTHEATGDPEEDRDVRKKEDWQYHFAKCLDGSYMVDVVSDIGTLACFMIATIILVIQIPNDSFEQSTNALIEINTEQIDRPTN